MIMMMVMMTMTMTTMIIEVIKNEDCCKGGDYNGDNYYDDCE